MPHKGREIEKTSLGETAMKIVVPRDPAPEETRIAMVPVVVRKLVDLGASVTVEAGLGGPIGVADSDFTDAGATIGALADAAPDAGDMVLRLNPPTPEEAAQLPAGCLHVSYLDPFRRLDLVKQLAGQGVNTLCMELIPRSTIAQKMDALSSQANLAGYMAVLLAMNALDKIAPMMMTPAGTLAPARVFVIGAGVAGLQAIATAKRLGARVDAFDTRPVVEEQVASLGARFLKVDLGETGQTEGGYAKALTEAQLARQRDAMAKACAKSDVLITTAQVFGRKAPLIITADMVDGMHPGSVIVDMAVDTGGNVAGSEPEAEVHRRGVKLLGYSNLARRVPVDASQMYASNLFNLVDHFWDAEANAFRLNRDDDIIKSALVTCDGAVVNDTIKARME